MWRINRAAIARKCARFCQTDVPPVHQADERFVDQGACLKHVARTLTPEIPARQLAELCFDERDELVEGGIVPFSPGNEKLRDLGWPEGGRG